jgi:hypothetical protein
MKKRKRGKEIMGAEFWERHERTQKMLADRIAYHERKLAEQRAELEKRDHSRE